MVWFRVYPTESLSTHNIGTGFAVPVRSALTGPSVDSEVGAHVNFRSAPPKYSPQCPSKPRARRLQPSPSPGLKKLQPPPSLGGAL